ncbi:MAG: hypothetical protein JWN78_1841 [Bacteroidota bacterium]|nr:hypothetical protein [Bacteroidota bacterium]
MKIKDSIYQFKFLSGTLPLICLMAVLVSSCNEQQPGKNAGEKLYFDLAAVVQKDIDSNSAHHCGEEKSVLVDHVTEVKTISDVDWKKELLPLSECDINKPAWKTKFSVDTIKNTEGTKIQYHALSDKINVRSMMVSIKNNEVEKIIITKKINSIIFSSDQRVEYFPGKGFSVRGEQKAAMMKNFEINVDVKYRCK